MKLSSFVMVTSGLMLLLNIAGFTTLTGWALGQLGVNLSAVQNFVLNAFWVAILAGIALLGASNSGIKLGIFGISINPYAGAVLASAPLVALIGDFVSIVTLANSGGASWVSWLIALILIPYMFGYGMALFDWVRGGSA